MKFSGPVPTVDYSLNDRIKNLNKVFSDSVRLKLKIRSMLKVVKHTEKRKLSQFSIQKHRIRANH